MVPDMWSPEMRASLERIGRVLGEMSSLPNSLRPFLEAQEQMSRNLAAQRDQFAKVGEALEESLRPLRETMAKMTAGIDLNAFAKVNCGISRMAEGIIALGQTPRFDLPLARIPRIELQIPKVFSELTAQLAEMGRRISEAAEAMMEREAKLRGITKEEFLQAFQSSAEFLEGKELETYQAVVAWNLYGLGEISFVRLFRALPPKARPLPAERSGVRDDDFQPLVSGIRRSEPEADSSDGNPGRGREED